MMKPRKTLDDITPNALITGAIFTALNNMSVPWKTDIDGLTLDMEYYGNISGSKNISPLVNKMLGDNETLTAENITTLATVLFKLNNANWVKQYATLNMEYNPISNYDMTETETASGTTSDTRKNTGTQQSAKTGTETTTHTGTTETENESSVTGNSSGTSENGIYGFNSSTASGDTEGETTATSTNTANGTDTRTDNLTDTRTDNLTDTRTDNLTEQINGSNSNTRQLTRSGNIGVTTSQQMIQSERDLYLWNFFYNVVFRDVDKVLTIATYSNR